jgi:hypothetical protein
MVVSKNHPPDRCLPHMPADPPPKKKPLTTSGGVRNTTHPKKNHFSHFSPFLPIRYVFFQNGFWENEDGFSKSERGFFSARAEEQKPLSFFHRCHEQGESKLSFSLFFRIFGFSVTVPILQELLRPAGGEFGETEGGFCPAHAHIQ